MMSSVVAFDIGNHSCYIAVARQGGIEVITNDYSLHATPSCVSFGPRNRSIGVSARQQVYSNLKNTIINFKHLIGRKYSDEYTQRIKEFIPCDVVQLPDDYIGLKVNYLGEERVFTPEQILAALLVKLKDTTSYSLTEVSKVTDCVISVPFFFTDTQRRCLIAASQMANINCLRILNETTAVALAYGIYKQDLPVDSEKPRIVLFIDAGHSAMQTCLVAYNKGKLTVLGSTFDLSVGGLAFDIILRDHFRTMFNNEFKIDAATNERAWLRLLDECEKVKKQMSANSTTIPLNIECFMDGKDVSGKINRTEFEQLSEHIFDKIRNLIQRALDECQKKAADVDEIEIVGGSSRIPMIRKIISDIFGKDAKTTMNQDEAVARGCAMQCAILSPSFRVREFVVKDSQPFRIKLAWGSVGLTDGGENDVFHEHDEFPFSKMLTLYRTEPFQLNATYSLPNQVPYLRQEIGSWKIFNVTPNEAGEPRKVKIKVRINPNGIFAVCSANIYNTIPVLENAAETTNEMVVETKENEKNSNTDSTEQQQQPPVDSNTQQPPTGAFDNDNMTTDENKSDEAAVGAADRKDKKSKTKTQVIDLPIEESIPWPYSTVQITSFKDIETSMQQTDRREKEKADSKNTVEEYVYEMRGKLCDQLADFVDEQDLNAFQSLLSATEDWLYNEGDDVEKIVYASKLSDLKKFGDPIVERYREFELRGSAFASLSCALDLIRKEYDLYLAKDDKYSHIDEKDMARLHMMIDEKQRWLDDSIGRQERRRKSEPPIVFVHQIVQQQQALENVARPILNKPKPSPPIIEAPPIVNVKSQHPTDTNGGENQEHPETDMIDELQQMKDVSSATATVNGNHAKRMDIDEEVD